jgi:hypothetical protein
MSANINVLDLVYTVRRFGPDFDIRKDDPIWLVTPDASMFTRLLGFEYQEFLRKFVANLRILPSCHDVYLSELEKQSFELFVQGFEHFTANTAIRVAEKRFEIHVPALFSDLIMPIVGRVHEEILMGLKHFTGFIKAVGNRPDGVFLNAKAPTPESQFIQMWVASKLKVPASPAATVVVVV